MQPPTEVRFATALMWLIWAGGAFYALGAWLEVSRKGVPNATVLAITYAIVLVALAILIRAVTLGRNWARLTYSGLAVLAVAAIVRTWFAASMSRTQLLISAAVVIAYATVLFLLFLSGSAPWFKKSAR
jgi:hypothetical protein